MSFTTRPQQIADALDTLDGPTPDEAADLLNEYDAKDSIAAVASRTYGDGGNGGSNPLSVVRVPIAFDDSGITPTGLPITAVSVDNQTFTVSGNHAASFPAGRFTSVFGSSSNDNPYTVVAASFGAGSTVIEVMETPNDDTADGVIFAVTGVAVATISSGDVLLAADQVSTIFVSEAWDGDSPAGYLFCDGSADYSSDIGAFSSRDLTAEDSDVSQSGLGLFQTTSGMFSGDPIRFTATTDLLFVIDNGQYGDPVSSQGEGEIILFVLKA